MTNLDFYCILLFLLFSYSPCQLPRVADLAWVGMWQLPCIMWLCIVKPRRFSFSWCLNCIIIFLGVLLMVVSSIGGLRAIIVSASTYKFYE